MSHSAKNDRYNQNIIIFYKTSQLFLSIRMSYFTEAFPTKHAGHQKLSNLKHFYREDTAICMDEVLRLFTGGGLALLSGLIRVVKIFPLRQEKVWINLIKDNFTPKLNRILLSILFYMSWGRCKTWKNVIAVCRSGHSHIYKQHSGPSVNDLL